MLDERLQALLHNLEQLPEQDQQRLADQIEEWLDSIEWIHMLNGPGPDALYEAALEEILDTPHGLKPDGCSVLRRSQRHASPKALPKPLYVLGGVMIAMQACSAVRARVPADG